MKIEYPVSLPAKRFYVWKCSGTHEIICHDRKDMKERTSYGQEMCEDWECEYCNDSIGKGKIHDNAPAS